jgi:hypothetical protein
MKKKELIIVLYFTIFSLFTSPAVYAQDDDASVTLQERDELGSAETDAQNGKEPVTLQERGDGPAPPPAPINMALPCLALLGIGLAYKVVKKNIY